ncbi:MAG: ABC transporter permease [Cyanobacteria bacterium J06642_2]
MHEVKRREQRGRRVPLWFKLGAFASKDLRVATSYRVSFLLRNLGIVTFTLLFYFLSRAVDGTDTAAALGARAGYFPFVIVGLAFYGFLNTLVNDFPESIRTAQTFGVLEPMLMTSTPIPAILLGTLMYPLLQSGAAVLTYFVLAVLLGVEFAQVNVLSTVVVFAFTLLAFSGLGALMAALVMVFKQNSSRIVLQFIFILFGGVFFPAEALPEGVRWMTHLVPLAPALQGMRAAVLDGAKVWELWPSLQALGMFAIVLLPAGFLSFRWAVRIAQKDGTLTYR